MKGYINKGDMFVSYDEHDSTPVCLDDIPHTEAQPLHSATTRSIKR